MDLALVLCVARVDAAPRAQVGDNSDQQAAGTASTSAPPLLKGVSFKQHLDEMLPLDATFRDDAGRAVTLGQFFGKRPVLLAVLYYDCPMLWTQVMNGLSSALEVIPFAAGLEIDVVLISFDPRDTPAIAAEKRRTHLENWSAEQDAALRVAPAGAEPRMRP